MLWGWPLCHPELLPSGSEMSPPVPKAEAFRRAGSVSVETHLRKGEKCCAAAVRKN